VTHILGLHLEWGKLARVSVARDHTDSNVLIREQLQQETKDSGETSQ
jgi:hypothetical protein